MLCLATDWCCNRYLIAQVSFVFYRTLWSMQDYFRNPNQISNDTHWKKMEGKRGLEGEWSPVEDLISAPLPF